jgi:hypothetical protein
MGKSPVRLSPETSLSAYNVLYLGTARSSLCIKASCEQAYLRYVAEIRADDVAVSTSDR